MKRPFITADPSLLMFALGSSRRFYLYDGFCDMRKSFDGLCGLIGSGMQCQATSGEVFVFLNRSRTHMKLLHWQKGGFVLYYKRLESGTFMPPNVKNGELSWAFSSSSCRSLRNSGTPKPPYFYFQLKNVACEKPICRHISSTRVSD